MYNPYRKYCRSWWRHWLRLPGDVVEFLRRLWYYAPVIWEDRDFDFIPFLKIIRLKLLRVRKVMENHSMAAHAEDRVAELAKADVLLRNVLEEDPDDEWSMHYNQWHIGQRDGINCKVRRDCDHALVASANRTERNWRRLWRHIEKYSRGWWD